MQGTAGLRRAWDQIDQSGTDPHVARSFLFGAMRDFRVALLLCPLSTGCIGDGGFGVMGTVRSADGARLEDCQVQLSVDAPDRASYYSREFTPPEFSERFTVSPFKRSYSLIVSCSGHRPYQATIRYGTAVAAGGMVDLGPICLDSAADGTC